MKKVFLLATAALFITGASFAQDGKKKCTKSKSCCKDKAAKSCCKDKAKMAKM